MPLLSLQSDRARAAATPACNTNLVCVSLSFTEQQRQAVMREVLEDLISPNELGKKYNIPPQKIRQWIKKAGHTLPQSYKR